MINVTTNVEPPIADAGSNQTVYVGAPVVLDGSGSFDPQGTPLGYRWTVLSALAGSAVAAVGSTNTVTTSFTPDRLGEYEIELIVDDGLLSSAPDTVIITAEFPPTDLEPIRIDAAGVEIHSQTLVITGLLDIAIVNHGGIGYEQEHQVVVVEDLDFDRTYTPEPITSLRMQFLLMFPEWKQTS